VSQIEKEKMLLQHKINEYQRKAEQENEKRRNVENEGKLLLLLKNVGISKQVPRYLQPLEIL
jgi:hypothetical protein